MGYPQVDEKTESNGSCNGYCYGNEKTVINKFIECCFETTKSIYLCKRCVKSGADFVIRWLLWIGDMNWSSLLTVDVDMQWSQRYTWSLGHKSDQGRAFFATSSNSVSVKSVNIVARKKLLCIQYFLSSVNYLILYLYSISLLS